MKPITREDCELMLVWDDDMLLGKCQRLVALIEQDGGCFAFDDGAGRLLKRWDHCAPIEKEPVKKWVPCECKADLPNGFVNGWIRNKQLGMITRVGFYWINSSGEFFGYTFKRMFDILEWSPTFDGPYQPIGKLVEVENVL